MVDMTGPEKVATFLLSLDKDASAAVLRHISAEVLTEIAEAMTRCAILSSCKFLFMLIGEIDTFLILPRFICHFDTGIVAYCLTKKLSMYGNYKK